MSDNKFSERGSLPTFLVVILAVVFIGVSVVAGYFLGGYFRGETKVAGDVKDIKNTTIDATNQEDNNNFVVVPDNINNNQPPTSTTNNIPVTVDGTVIKMSGISFDLAPYKISSGDGSTSLPIQYTSLPTEIAEKINWTGFYPIESLGFFNHDFVSSTENDGYQYLSSYYIGGWFEYSDKKGLVVFANISCDGMGCTDFSDPIFVLYDSQVVVLKNYGNIVLDKTNPLFESFGSIVLSRIKIDKNFRMSYLDFPEKLELKPGVVLTDLETRPASKYSGDVFRNGSLKKVGTVPVFGDVYSDDGGAYFYILGKDGRERLYQYIPSVLSNKEKTETVVYNDGQKVTGYHAWSSSGCGGIRLDIMSPERLNVVKDLKEVGKTVSGLKVLGFVDNNHEVLRGIYDGVYYPSEGEKISYDGFVAMRPVVFWIDPLGRLLTLQLGQFAPVAECGKPVIYLYPEKDTKVKVNLQVEKFSYTEPEYGNGWEVLARPDGEITNLSDGKNYPYLFWEGNGVGEQPEAKEGFVVARGEVNKFLNDKLVQLGLQGREVSDFIEFWQPRMTKAPYYFVTFYGTNTMNKIAPLTVQPKPDTIIRILMDYRPLDKPIVVKEQKLSHLPRVGFTVIEWGGVLGRE